MVKLERLARNIANAEPTKIAWVESPGLVAYSDAVAAMERHADAIHRGEAPELVWLLQHPPLYTAGTSAMPDDLLDPDRFPVFQSGRGGQYTYHGPGQRVVYLMLDLARREKDVRRFVRTIESWIIDAVGQLGVAAICREGRTGIWAPRPDKGPLTEDKIAAIGIRVRRWVSFHGASINVAPNLSHYAGIVACGITDQGVTSLADLGRNASMGDLDEALFSSFSDHFGRAIERHATPNFKLPSSQADGVPL